ncbi:hypothetical protein Tco_0678036 [Tanacetum coccineum]|uniref:Uncharacterized protein n=1 Tax=Tanacetum coccineum TaxID=301880 RepID=A0ABQ4XEH5_9ASTR
MLLPVVVAVDNTAGSTCRIRAEHNQVGCKHPATEHYKLLPCAQRYPGLSTRALKNKGVFSVIVDVPDEDCKQSLPAEFQDFNGGLVAFGGSEMVTSLVR